MGSAILSLLGTETDGGKDSRILRGWIAAMDYLRENEGIAWELAV
jgi:hypothetical protein